MSPAMSSVIGRCSQRRTASSINSSARLPARTSSIPATVRTLGSGDPSALTRRRPAAFDPVALQSDLHTYRRASCAGPTPPFSHGILSDHRPDVVLLPRAGVVGGEVVEPDGQDVLGDAKIAKALTAAVRENDEVEMDVDRHYPAYSREIRGVLVPVDGTAQQDHATECCPGVIRQHRDASTMAVGEHVEPVERVRLDPCVELAARERAGEIAVATGPVEAITGAVQGGVNIVVEVLPEIARGRLPPIRVLGKRPVDDQTRVRG